MVYVGRDGQVSEEPPLVERIREFFASLWILLCLIVTSFIEPFVNLSGAPLSASSSTGRSYDGSSSRLGSSSTSRNDPSDSNRPRFKTFDARGKLAQMHCQARTYFIYQISRI